MNKPTALFGIVIALMLYISLVVNSFAQQFKQVDNVAIPASVANNSGIAVVDYDLDGYLDVYISKNLDTEELKRNRLLRNLGNGAFEDATNVAGLGAAIGGTGISWGDYDNDGDPDVFITGVSENELFKNNGNGTFTNVTDESGLGGFCSNCQNLFQSSLWWDYDYDGDLDLYVTSNFVHPIQYENNGDGTFTQTSLGAEASPFFSYCALPLDFNSDGVLDLYVSNDFDMSNFLFINDKSSFVESASDYGVEDLFDGMGLASCDYDNNGYFDFAVTNIFETSLYSQSENGFTNVASTLGIDTTGWAWGIVFDDFDNDGFEDLFIVNQANDNAVNHLFMNVESDGKRGFSNRNVELSNNGDHDSRGVVSFDYDNDGDLDLLITNMFARPILYENTASAGNHLRVVLEGVSTNRDAIGTEVSVTTSNGSQHRIKNGVGFLSQSNQPLHFGLATDTEIQTLSIKWPSGVVQQFASIQANNTIKVKEGFDYEIIDVKPVTRIFGCTDPNSCSYNPSATADDGSCIYLDAGQIDGQRVVLPLSKHIYTYESTEDLVSYEWNVQHGEILSGQGTSSIEVLWDIAQTCSITAKAASHNCSTETIELPVTVQLTTIDNTTEAFNQHSIARLWNETLLAAIRKDYARPTVHARNLFHTAIAMYDTWAVYNNRMPYLLGQELNSFVSNFSGFTTDEDPAEALNTTMSFVCYRLLIHRFVNSPGFDDTLHRLNDLMAILGYDTTFESMDYLGGNPAALGNFIANEIINYGLQDGSNEEGGYGNLHYEHVNDPFDPRNPGNGNVNDPNRWQPLTLEVFIDQSGNILRENTPGFLSPEWGEVYSFALSDESLVKHTRGGYDYWVYHDPGDPPYLSNDNQESSELYKWAFSLVAVWASHLSPHDDVMWDISPASIGNIPFEELPTSFTDYDQFYNLLQGGDIGTGHAINPVTNSPYEPQIVPRGDYARVLAEFWADGPASETPPGHWFTILNYINDHPDHKRRIHGEGDEIDNLEWDVKSYFLLGGTMHDAAITAWAVKGRYDYIRPISAIRYMAEMGQSTNSALPNYSPMGIPLIDGYIEQVSETDELAGNSGEHVGKIKLYTWRGHATIYDQDEDEAGVGWILAENWWPYQRPSFITPPFAGYVSGHSTFSRAAAEVLTYFTGSAYFPGGMGRFMARKNEFLVFEEGPSQDIELQWATYRDASDQCSLSRIWGGIHPPIDDIPGRIIGEKVGKNAFAKAMELFNTDGSGGNLLSSISNIVYPNPVQESGEIHIISSDENMKFELLDTNGRNLTIESIEYDSGLDVYTIGISNLPKGIYILKAGGNTWRVLRL